MSGTREQFRPFDVAEYLDTPSTRAAYLKAMLEDSQDSPAIVAKAVGDVARAIGMTQIAKDGSEEEDGHTQSKQAHEQGQEQHRASRFN